MIHHPNLHLRPYQADGAHDRSSIAPERQNMLDLCSHFGFDPVDSSWYLPEGSHVPSSQTQPGIHVLLAAFGTCSTSRYPIQQ